MQVVQNLIDLKREDHEEIALVPTMGALHEGHAALIRSARALTDSIMVSVFVNPLQFENSKDLESYPRSPGSDIEVASRAGATAMWFPNPREIFPEDIEPHSAEKIGDLYEGASRPGHFSGVLTVVSQLFKLARPSFSIFGEKDFQQLFLIKKMVEEEKLPIKIIAHPTVRDSDGLAMSSRNVRLRPQDRQPSLLLYQALSAATKSETLAEQKQILFEILDSDPSFRLDYAAIIDEETFSPAVESTVNKRALVAGWINGVRLIDNMPMGDRGKREYKGMQGNAKG